jgi:drug/metabolite transporter (DMT)-like permease
VDPLAVGLIAIAAVLHVAWNVLLKTAGEPLRTATVGVGVASLVLVPVAFLAWLLDGRPAIPAEAFVVGVVSGVVEVGYFVLLSAAYRRGDLSLVYPLARGTAPLLAVAIGVVILGERLPPLGFLGVALLLAGLLTVQRPWRLLRAASAGDRPAAGFALATGVAIATYSALDRVGAQLAPTIVYAAILWATCALGLVLWVTAGPGSRAAALSATSFDARRGIAAGAMTIVAYGLVLVALSRAPLAAVAPLRESAIVLATLVGVTRLGEGRGGGSGSGERVLRVGGALLIVGGAALLAVAG